MDKYVEEIGMTDSEFKRQCQAADKNGAEHLARLPKAASAHYDKKSKRIVLELSSFIFTILLFVCCLSVAAQNKYEAETNKELLPPIRESFEKEEHLVMSWRSIRCLSENEKEVNPPNCPENNTPKIWRAADSLTLYNSDGTIWYNFSINSDKPRHFLKNKKAGFLPFLTDGDLESITLRTVSESPSWYEVEVNEDTQATKFVLKSDPMWMKVTWNFLLAEVRILSFDGENQPQLFDKPNGNVIEESSEIKWKDLRFRLKIEGEWAFVEGYQPGKNAEGWVRWRKGREMLFESKLWNNIFKKFPRNE
ncbi:MAG: hypothetical protein ABI891_11225 [Acidobacteriota bacterium]